MLPVLAAADDWVVVAKPSGLAVHRSPELNDPTYVVQEARRQFGRYVWPVHRLDRPTSGCLLLAFSAEAVEPLAASLAGGRKRYLAMVRGCAAIGPPVVIETPMKDSFGVLRAARTTARCLAATPDPRASLVLAEPHTGRFHQVRRHLRDLSHPVLGDGVHGDSRVNRWWREARGLHRLGLHCVALDLVLPDGEPLRARCPIPDDLGAVWAALPGWLDAAAAVDA